MNRNVAGIAGALFALCAARAPAVVLDWDAVTWTAGSLSQSYDIDPAKAGNDITLSITGSTGRLQPNNTAPNPQTPAITNTLQGGLGTAQNTLNLALDLNNQNQFVTITVNFSALYTLGVNNVSFTIFDVDFANSGGSNFQDQLRSISALSIDGTTLIAPTITTSASNTLTGSGLAQVVSGTATAADTGAGSNAGNVTISFGTNAIKSLTFAYGSGSGTVANPTYQDIGIHDISFTPVPELNPAWSAVLSCIAVVGLVLRRRSICQRR